MRKTAILIPMGAAIELVPALGRIDGLLASPVQTPAAFLSSMPNIVFVVFGATVVLIQQSSTVLVYLLLTCWTIDFLVAATAHAVAEGKGRAFLLLRHTLEDTGAKAETNHEA